MSESYIVWRERILADLTKGVEYKLNKSIKETIETQLSKEKEIKAKKKEVDEDDTFFVVYLALLRSRVDNVFVNLKQETVNWLEKQSRIKRPIFKLKGKARTDALAKHLKKKGTMWADTAARTNTSSLNTHIIETKSTNIGGIAYIWDSLNDRLTRPGHRFMNGVICFWNDKPIPGKYETKYKNTRRVAPGEDYNCRCVPNPIFDWKYILKGKNRIRVWNDERVVTMTRKQFLNLLERKIGVVL